MSTLSLSLDDLPSLGPPQALKALRLERAAVLRHALAEIGPEDCLVSALGFITRDLYALTPELRQRCFYCMGSMGSILPIALGVSLARPRIRVLGLEGDGSLLMNLGALVTASRYGRSNLGLVVFDNRQYESSGGQPSQPDHFELASVCRATGLETRTARTLHDFDTAVRAFVAGNLAGPLVVVVQVAPSAPHPRVEESPQQIASRFAAHLGSHH